MTTTTPTPDLSITHPETLAYAVTRTVSVLTEAECRQILAAVIREHLDCAGVYPDADVVAAMRCEGVSTPVAELFAGVADRLLTQEAGSEAHPAQALRLALSALVGSEGRGIGPRRYRSEVTSASQQWDANMRAEAQRGQR